MNNIVKFEVTATPETALKKLSKANIPVYGLKKHSSRLTFGVRQEYSKKVFAIFSHPCYNTVIREKSVKNRFWDFFKKRFGLAVGALLFLTAALLSGNSLLRIKVTGNGNYLAPQVLKIANDCGAKEWTLGKKIDVPTLKARVTSLPSVNFCSVERAGAYLIIDVRTEEEHTSAVDYKPLASPIAGKVIRLVAVCGTAEKKEGDEVSSGDILIGAYELDADGEKNDCIAVGFAEISARASISVFAESESDESMQAALKAAALYSDNVSDRSVKVVPCDGGVRYEVTFTYLKVVSVNME